MSNQTASGRKVYIDAAKGVGILMVMFGHITDLGNPIDTWFNSVKLPIFFVVSGYLLCMRQSIWRGSRWEYVKKLCRTLLLPYFGYSTLVIIYHVFVGIMRGREKSDLLNRFIGQAFATLTGKGISALWFLPAMFVAEVLFLLLMRAPKTIRTPGIVLGAVVPIVAGQCIPRILEKLDTMRHTGLFINLLHVTGKGLVGFWFIGCGYLSYLALRRIKQRNTRLILGIVLFTGNLILSHYNLSVSLNAVDMGTHPSFYYIGGTAGSLGTLLILQYLERWWKMSFLSYCGRNSLIIMATHGTMMFKQMAIAGWIDIAGMASSAGIKYYLDCTCVLAVLMLMECGIIMIVENYLPWLTGRRKKESKEEKQCTRK